MRLSNYNKILLISLLGIIVLTASTFFIIIPLLNKIRAASNEYLTNQKIISRFTESKTFFMNLEKKYKNNQDDISKIEGAFLSKKDIVDFVATLERIAVQTNNIFEIQFVESLDQKIAAPKETIPSLSFRISLKGNFNNLLDFIAHLENSPFPPYRLISLEDLAIKKITNISSALDSDFNGTILQSDLSIRIYNQ